MKWLSAREEKLGRKLDCVVRGEGREARVVFLDWIEPPMASKETLMRPEVRAVRPASPVEVKLWQELSQGR